ncbi:MAG: helix-turn-helix domain-containing protein [Victivallales bacterium]|nr:helix-turn-helix domain-containing protein [Victivallales bacterium]
MEEKEENVLSSESLRELSENGHITEEVRVRLKQRIHALHMPRVQIARQIGVSLSTLHKWEHGPTTRCSLVMRRKLTALLQGDNIFIDDLEDNGQQESFHWDYLNENVRAVMEKIGKGYGIFSETPVLGDRYLHLMDTAASDILMSLIPPLVSSFKKQQQEESRESQE